jgi:hypothetical protein
VTRIRTLLGVQVEGARTAAAGARGGRADRAHGERQPDVGAGDGSHSSSRCSAIAVSKDAVAKYMPKPSRPVGRPPSVTWGAFLHLYLAGTIAIDFLTVPTATFSTLYVFIVLSLARRRLLHVNVTAHPRSVRKSVAAHHAASRE